MKLCSACLLGIRCRHDGQSKANKKILQIAKDEILIPVCPEQLGGRPTPREQTEIKGKRVLTKSGKDVTDQFKKGASEVLRIVKTFNIKKAILKQRSPSCGVGKIYDGTFSNKVIDGFGVTAQLLKDNNIDVVSEEAL